MLKTTKIILIVSLVWGMLSMVVFPFISLFYDEVVDAKKRQEQQQICATFGMSEDFRPNDYSLQTNNENAKLNLEIEAYEPKSGKGLLIKK